MSPAISGTTAARSCSGVCRNQLTDRTPARTRPRATWSRHAGRTFSGMAGALLGQMA